MFHNSTSRDLIADSYSDNRDSYDSMLCSQLPYSQPGLSQMSSQDMFTQQYSSGSQGIEANNHSRKTTLYEKWKNKMAPSYKPLKNNTSSQDRKVPSNALTNKQQPKIDISFQQQLQITKTRAREMEEWNSLQLVVRTVEDCSKEMKSTLSFMKEKIEFDGEKAGQNIQQSLNTFFEELCLHQDNMLQALKAKADTSSRLLALEKELALRDAKIEVLEKSLHEGDMSEKIVQSLEEKLQKPQQLVEKKLSEILESTRDTNQQNKQSMTEHTHRLDDNRLVLTDIQKNNQSIVKDSEKRLMSELSKLRKELTKKDTSLLHDVTGALQSAQEEQRAEIEKVVQQLSNRKTCKSTDNGLQKKDIQDMLKKHWDAAHKVIVAQFKDQVKNQEQHLCDIVTATVGAAEKRDMDVFKSCLTLPAFESRMGECHADFKKQIEELHEKHMMDLKEMNADTLRRRSYLEFTDIEHSIANILQRTIKTDAINELHTRADMKDIKWNPEPNVDGHSKRLTSDLDQSCNYRTEDRKPAMMSPLTANYKKLDTRAFFSTAAPSPLAVLMPQTSVDTVTVDDVNSDRKMDDDTEERDRHIGKKVRKARRKKSRYGKAKKNMQVTKQPSPSVLRSPEKKLRRGDEEKSKQFIEEIVPTTLASVKPYRPNTVVKTFQSRGLSMYDFADEDVQIRQDRSKHLSYDRTIKIVSSSESTSVSREISSPESVITISGDSSPCLSITEIVVKRKINYHSQRGNLNINLKSGVNRSRISSHLSGFSTTKRSVIKDEGLDSLWTNGPTENPAQSLQIGQKRRLSNIDDRIINRLRSSNQ